MDDGRVADGLVAVACGTLKRIGTIPFGSVLLPILLVTTIFCRSTGALALLVVGMMLLWLSVRFRTRLLLAGLLLVAPLYVGVRLTNLWSGQQAVDLAKAVVGPDRAESLEYRFKCENLLAAKALEQPIFGWGGWGRSAVYFDAETDWKKPVPTDGLWIIVLGTKGFVGLSLFYLALVLPAVLFVWRFPARPWGDPRLAAGSLAAVFLGLYMVDCLLNAFPNMIYITLAGGLIGLEPKQLRAIPAARRGIEAAGRRAVGGALRRGRGRYRDRRRGARSGRITLADRCRSLGRSFKQEGRLDEAEAAWRQALDLLATLMEADPDADGLRRRWCDCANDLAWLRANHPDPARRDPASAVAMARRAVDECPDAAAYWNTLGVAYYRAGDDGSAVAALDRARALGGGTAFDDVFLAMAHARLGDPEGARQALARAMLQAERDYPGHPELAGFCDEAQSILAGAAGAPPRSVDAAGPRPGPFMPVDQTPTTVPRSMRITWYGHAAVLIETRGLRIILDPYRSPDSGGYLPIDEPADIVVVSHEQDVYHSHIGQIVPPFRHVKALEIPEGGEVIEGIRFETVPVNDTPIASRRRRSRSSTSGPRTCTWPSWATSDMPSRTRRSPPCAGRTSC